MQSVQEMISIYHMGYLICMAVSIFFLICSVIMFIRFNIPKILSDKTGRALKKSMKLIEEKNARTGSLRMTGQTGRIRTVGQTGKIRTERASEAQVQSHIVPPAPATDILTPGTDVLETHDAGPDKASDAAYEQTGGGIDTASKAVLGDNLPIPFKITKRLVIIHTGEAIQ